MANIAFKKGLLANLPSSYAEGTFYVTTDERAIYLDVDSSTRIRLGDFQEFSSLEALQANSNPSTTALYYISGLNILAKWNGTEYVQINKDTGATSFEVTGDGNAITGVSYDATTRKLTLTKGATYMKEADVDSKISTAVGTLGNDSEGNAYANVKAYVDAKTSGIATDAALSELQEKIEAAEGEIDALQAATGENGSVTTAIAAAQKTADDAAAAAKAAQDTADTKTTMAEVEAKGYATKTEAQGYADAKDEAISAAQSKADSAYELAESKATLDEVKALDYATKSEAQGYADAKDEAIAAAQKAGDDAQDAVDALSAKVGEVPEDKTVVDMIAEAQTAATYDDTQVKADIKANADAIAAIEEDYLTSADKDSLQEQINTIMNNPDTEGVINSINEFTQYISDHGTIAEGFRTDIDANAEAIAANAKAISDQATADEAKYETKTDASAKLTEAKEYADGLNTAMDIRVKVLEAIDHDAYVAADEAVLASAKGYTDEKNTAMDTRVKVLEAIDHEAYKAYADQAELDAIAAAKTETENQVKALAEGAVAANTAAVATKAEQADLDDAVTRIGTAEGKISDLETASATHALKTEVEAVQTALDEYEEANDAAVALKANAADVYAKSETYTKDEVDAAVEAALTWGSF